MYSINYRKQEKRLPGMQSEKKQSEAGKKAVTVREIKRGNIDLDTVSESEEEKQETGGRGMESCP